MRATVVLALSLLLVGCGSSGTPAGGRPDIKPEPSTESDLVKFPSAPADAYIALKDADGNLYGQLPVPPGATSLRFNPNDVLPYFAGARRVPAGTLIPAHATEASANPFDAPVTLLQVVMFSDVNRDQVLDSSEQLPLMTHDRLAYAERPFTLSYRTAEPAMQHNWNVHGGLTRVEHYVYKPLASSEYKRRMTSQPLVFELHVPTPLTSK